MRQIYCTNPDWIPALFPELRLVEESDFVGQGQMYVGRGRPIGDPTAYQYNRALLPGTEVSIPDRWAAVNFAHQRKGKNTVPKSLERHCQKLQDHEFLRELFFFMAFGKWEKLTSADSKVYELFDALTQSKVQFLKMYFDLRRTHSYQELWASVLTFFIRVSNYDPKDPNISPYYKTVIEKFRAQSSKFQQVVQFIFQPDFGEACVLDFLLSVR